MSEPKGGGLAQPGREGGFQALWRYPRAQGHGEGAVGTAGPAGAWALQGRAPLTWQPGVEGVIHPLMGSSSASYTQDQDVKCRAPCRVKARGPCSTWLTLKTVTTQPETKLWPF